MTLRRISFLLLIFLVASCGPKKKLPEGAPAYLKEKALWKAIDENAFTFKALEIKGNGSFNDNKGTKLSFRYTLRVLKDSLIWVDLADPILGLKLVRAQITRDEVAYYNRLDRSYFKGKSSELAANAGFRFDFEPLMAALGANVLRWDQKWSQELIPNYYRLHNYPSDSMIPMGEVNLIKQDIGSTNFRPQFLELRRPSSGELMQIEFGEYQNFEGSFYPSQIKMRVLSGTDNNIELNVRSMRINQNFKFPFRIPNDYDAL